MRWRQLDSGVSAVSFGFVATAILVSMFLAMAILEHFLRAPAHTLGHASPGGSADSASSSAAAASVPMPLARISRQRGSSKATRPTRYGYGILFLHALLASRPSMAPRFNDSIA
jgi:hypothetical protein